MKRLLTLTTALTMLGSTAAIAAPMPEVLWPVPTVASQQNVADELRQLGFNNIMNYEHSGNVIETIATWEGEFVALRIDEDTGRISERNHPRVQNLNLASDVNEVTLVEALEARGYTVVGDFQERDRFYVVEVERLSTPSYIYIDPASGYYLDSAMVDRPFMPVVADWNAEYVRVQLHDMGFRNVDVENTGGALVTAEATRDGEPVLVSVDKNTGAVYSAS